MYQQAPPYHPHNPHQQPLGPYRHPTPPVPPRPVSQYLAPDSHAPRLPHRPPSFNAPNAGPASTHPPAQLQAPAFGLDTLSNDLAMIRMGPPTMAPPAMMMGPSATANPGDGHYRNESRHASTGQGQYLAHATQHLHSNRPPAYPIGPYPSAASSIDLPHRGSSFAVGPPNAQSAIPIAPTLPQPVSSQQPHIRHGSMAPFSSSSSQHLSVHSSASSSSGSSSSSVPPVVAQIPTIERLHTARAALDRWPDGEKLSWAEDVLRVMDRHLYPNGSPTEFSSATANGTDASMRLPDLPFELNELVGVAVPFINSTTLHPSTALAATALYLRARLLSNGACPELLPRDQRQAFRDFEAAAKSGESRAWFRLGRDYEGVGDLGRARECFEKGRNKGDCECTYRMGMAHLLGQLLLSPDPATALPLLQSASGLSNIDTPQPSYVYGMLLAGELSTPTPIPPSLVLPTSSSPSDALLAQWLVAREAIEHAAYLALPAAQAKCGYLYEHAALGSVYDPLMSVQWYSLASQAGVSDADMALSKWFLCGAEGHFGKNEELARTFAEKAARKGHPNGCFAMGYYYELGIGGRQDQEQAKKWYQRVSSSLPSPIVILPLYSEIMLNGQASKLDNADAKARLAALTSSNPHTMSLTEHQSKLNETLVRRHTQAKMRSDRSSVRRPGRGGGASGLGGRLDAARIDAAARAAAAAPPSGIAVGQVFSPNPQMIGQGNGQMPQHINPGRQSAATLAPSQAYHLPINGQSNGYSNGHTRPARPQINIPSSGSRGQLGPEARRPSNGAISPSDSSSAGGPQAQVQGQGARGRRGYTLTDGPASSGSGDYGGVRPSGSMASLHGPASAGSVPSGGQSKAKGPQTFAEMGFTSKPVEEDGCVVM